MEDKQVQISKYFSLRQNKWSLASKRDIRKGLPWWLSQSRICLRCRRPPVMQETQVRSLGQEDPLEKEMVTHSSIMP